MNVTERLRGEGQRRAVQGWSLARIELPRGVAAVLREEGQEVPGKLEEWNLEENQTDPSGTRYVYRCLKHEVTSCPICLKAKSEQ